MTKKISLCIHGHFYQPPRENPWIEDVQLQESAWPYHDWNERIFKECYRPNTVARLLDEHGKIVGITNNYEMMSFNFGPTLMSWLEQKHPEEYQQILKADHRSQKLHHGHGNAIAQIYNHMIMPLANERDKVTQTLWGIEDFKHRFGRNPEALWLPETACNEATLQVLIDAGMKFLILEPFQAAEVCLLDEKGSLPEKPLWQNVSHGIIAPHQAYRCFSKNDPGKFIDIFFYDGPISKEMGFGSLLFDAKHFMDRIDMARLPDMTHKIIHVATDGETYGHHKAFGERALAYLMEIEAPKRGYQMVNYGEFLEKNPPQQAVRLKEGENGEGTSWSCPHGVKRWKDHCGCRGNGPAEWTQHWRKPLREALDWLRDELSKVFEQYGSYYLNDVWAGRNHYIRILLEHSEENIRAFFRQHQNHELNSAEITTALKLLEMQRHAMLMYTSCGWFFTEISGIETVQILQYAARAMELAKEVSGQTFEEEFLKRLELAKSNDPQYETGRGVYDKLVRPKIMSFDHIVNDYAISSMVDQKENEKEAATFRAYALKVVHQRKEHFGDLALSVGRIQLKSKWTLEENDFAFIVVQIGAYDFRCSIQPFDEQVHTLNVENELFGELHSMHIVEILRRIDSIFGKKYYALKDLPLEQRMKIVSFLTKEMIEKISAAHESLYEDNRRMNEIYRSINLPIPSEIRYAAEHTLERRLLKAVVRLAGQDYDLKKASSIYRIIKDAEAFGITLKRTDVADFLSVEFERRARMIAVSMTPDLVFQCLNILRLADKINIELGQSLGQEVLFQLVKKWVHDPSHVPESISLWGDSFVELLTKLHINIHGFSDIFKTSTS